MGRQSCQLWVVDFRAIGQHALGDKTTGYTYNGLKKNAVSVTPDENHMRRQSFTLSHTSAQMASAGPSAKLRDEGECVSQGRYQFTLSITKRP